MDKLLKTIEDHLDAVDDYHKKASLGLIDDSEMTSGITLLSNGSSEEFAMYGNLIAIIATLAKVIRNEPKVAMVLENALFVAKSDFTLEAKPDRFASNQWQQFRNRKKDDNEKG